jgi:phosphoglycolate phosphatase-like HAD superfamily hydrolase
MAKPLIIFDVDGTLIGGESYDWTAFDAAFKAFSGFNFPAGFFDVVAEVTGQAIVRRALPDLDEVTIADAIRHISAGYASRLAVDIANHPDAFRSTPGANPLLDQLASRGYACAIATGDWFTSIEQKLDAAAIVWRGRPIATCSDRCARSEIIALAAERAGRPVHDAIYVGDGVWDFRATQSLGIAFIGVGPKRAALQSAGAKIVLPDLAPDQFFDALDQINLSSVG